MCVTRWPKRRDPPGLEGEPSRTFADVLAGRARREPDREAFVFLPDGDGTPAPLTYAALDRRARAVAARLVGRAAPGDRVLILCAPGLEYVAALFGCFYAGVVAVPAYPPHPRRPPRRLDAIVADCAPRFVLTDADTHGRLQPLLEGSPRLRDLEWHVMTREAGAADVPGLAPAPPDDGALAMLQYTSGSTGTPKGVRLTHDNLLRNSEAIFACFGHTRASRGVLWLPPYHDMGLVGGILQPMYGGCHATLMSPFAFLQRPLRWLQAVSTMGATTSGGPCFAYDLCVDRIRPEQRDTLDLSRWEVAFCGAEPIRMDVLDRFADYFAPAGFRREALYPCYGLAEATLIVSGGRALAGPVVRRVSAAGLDRHRAEPAPEGAGAGVRRVVGCGKAAPQHRVVVVDPERGCPLADGEIGEIWVSGPSLSSGYWSASVASDDALAATLAAHPGEWFLRTGDLGFLEGGDLFLTGRLKELIIVSGRNHYPHDIEGSVRAADPEVEAAAAFAMENAQGEEQLVVWVEHRRVVRADVAALRTAIRRALWEEHELVPLAIEVLGFGEIPRTSSGKIQRLECRRRHALAAGAPTPRA